MIVADVFIGVVQDGKLHLDWRKQFDAYLSRFEGHEVELEVRKRRSKRSLRQNRWMYAFLTPLAEHTGSTVEELKLIGLIALWGTHEVMGYIVPVRTHTSELNTLEFSDLCACYQQKADEVGVLILDPDEYRAAKKTAAKRAA